MLDHLDASGRFALLKLALGELRVGINARLAKQALAQAFGLEVDAVEEVWHGLRPPFAELFDWAEGRAEQPTARDIPVFRPFMLAHPLDETRVSLDDYAAEWKWDGIRVQLVHAGGETRLYSRTGDDISGSFPDVAEAFRTKACSMANCSCAGGPGRRRRPRRRRGELQRASAAARPQERQRRRCSGAIPPSSGSTTSCSTGSRICAAAVDRAAPTARGLRQALDPERFDVSQLIEAESFEELEDLRANARDVAIEGIMLKRRDSPYVAGRRTGLWYKWKRDPLIADCVLMYAQRGSGKRSSYYSDYTFGCWTEEGELLPVGKAYFGFTDEELRWLDRWIRGRTCNRCNSLTLTRPALGVRQTHNGDKRVRASYTGRRGARRRKGCRGASSMMPSIATSRALECRSSQLLKTHRVDQLRNVEPLGMGLVAIYSSRWAPVPRQRAESSTL